MQPLYRKDGSALTAEDVWQLVESVAPYSRRVLLYGPPGTGKSYIARTAGNPYKVEAVTAHPDLSAAELRGHFVPTDQGGFRWMDGPAIAAWRHGSRLVIDEIDKLGDDALSFLYAIADDSPTAEQGIALGTTGETIKPAPDFTLWGTMNGRPEDLPDPLRDRFTVAIEISGVHPAAFDTLPEDLRPVASRTATLPDRAVSIRRWMEYALLRRSIGDENAALAVFGPMSQSILDSLTAAEDARTAGVSVSVPTADLKIDALSRGYCGSCADDYRRTGGESYGAACGERSCPNFDRDEDEDNEDEPECARCSECGADIDCDTHLSTCSLS